MRGRGWRDDEAIANPVRDEVRTWFTSHPLVTGLLRLAKYPTMGGEVVAGGDHLPLRRVEERRGASTAVADARPGRTGRRGHRRGLRCAPGSPWHRRVRCGRCPLPRCAA